MTVTTAVTGEAPPLTGHLLRRGAAPAIWGLAFAVALVGLLTLRWGLVGALVVAALAAHVVLVGVSAVQEGTRQARDRAATLAMTSALALALAPLGAVLIYTTVKGIAKLDLNFLTHSMAGVGPISDSGGVYHAIVGTIEQVLLSSAVAVPIGLLAAIYITEYGGGRFAKVVRFLIDVMTGIPSIVSGLFIYTFWVLALGMGYSGFAGALALAVLMIPVVARSSEEMILLVPDSLREASLALGVSRSTTILRVVLPTALPGITTGIMLGIARVTGETAPLILTAFGNDFINTNPFSGQQSALPLFVFTQAGSAFDVAVQRAWAGALTLILIVLVLYVTARLITRRRAITRS